MEHKSIRYMNISLMDAAGHGHQSIVDYLIKERVNLDVHDSRGFTAVMRASRSGETSIVRKLIKAGANLDSTLIWSSWGGHEDITDLLLEAKADVDSKNNIAVYGNTDTAVMKAARHGYPRIVRKLLDAKANPDSALRWPCILGYEDIIDMLLEAKADVNIETHIHNSLFEASRHGYINIVKKLLNSKANVFHQNYMGNRAIDVADGSREVEVVELLKDAEIQHFDRMIAVLPGPVTRTFGDLGLPRDVVKYILHKFLI